MTRDTGVSSKVGASAPSNWRGQRLREQQEKAKDAQKIEVNELRARREQEKLDDRRQLLLHYSNYGISGDQSTSDVAEAVGQQDLEDLLHRHEKLIAAGDALSSGPSTMVMGQLLPNASSPNRAHNVFGRQGSSLVAPLPIESERDRRFREREEAFKSKKLMEKNAGKEMYLERLAKERRKARGRQIAEEEDAENMYQGHHPLPDVPRDAPTPLLENRHIASYSRQPSPYPVISRRQSPQPIDPRHESPYSYEPQRARTPQRVSTQRERANSSPVAFEVVRAPSPTSPEIDRRELERWRKKEYPDALKEQIDRKAHGDDVKSDVEAESGLSWSVTEAEEKRRRQRDYGNALKEQVKERKEKERGQRDDDGGGGDGWWAGDKRVEQERRMKREYGDALKEQMKAKMEIGRDADGSGGSPMQGVGERTVSAGQRRKKEYAAALKEQMDERKGRSRRDDGMEGGGFMGMGDNETNEEGRRRKMDYRNVLQGQMKKERERTEDQREHSPIIGRGERTMSADKARKAQYAMDLKQQMELHEKRKGSRHIEQDEEQGMSFGGESGGGTRRRIKAMYAMELQQQMKERELQKESSGETDNEPHAAVERGPRFKYDDDRSTKKAKEEDYRAELQRQIEQRRMMKEAEKMKLMEEESRWAEKLKRENEILQQQQLAEKAKEDESKMNASRKQEEMLLRAKEESERAKADAMAQKRKRGQEQRRLQEEQIEEQKRGEEAKGSHMQVDPRRNSIHDEFEPDRRRASLHDDVAPVHDEAPRRASIHEEPPRRSSVHEESPRRASIHDQPPPRCASVHEDAVRRVSTDDMVRRDEIAHLREDIMAQHETLKKEVREEIMTQMRVRSPDLTQSMIGTSEWLPAKPPSPPPPPILAPHDDDDEEYMQEDEEDNWCRRIPVDQSFMATSELLLPRDVVETVANNPYVRSSNPSKDTINTASEHFGETIDADTEWEENRSGSDVAHPQAPFDLDHILQRNDRRLRTLRATNAVSDGPLARIRQYLAVVQTGSGSESEYSGSDGAESSFYGNTRWLPSDPRMRAGRRCRSIRRTPL